MQILKTTNLGLTQKKENVYLYETKKLAWEVSNESQGVALLSKWGYRISVLPVLDIVRCLLSAVCGYFTVSSWETELWSQLKGSSEIALDFGWWLAIKRLMSEFKQRSFASYCWRAGKDLNFTTEKENSVMIWT